MIPSRQLRNKFLFIGLLTAVLLGLFDAGIIGFKNYFVLTSSFSALIVFLLFSFLNLFFISLFTVVAGLLLYWLIDMFIDEHYFLYRFRKLRFLENVFTKLAKAKILYYIPLFFFSGIILSASVIKSPFDAFRNPSNPFRFSTESVEKKPNVFIIILDTLRADRLSQNGYPIDCMPNLTKFAKEATLFRNTIATSSFTPPSHLSIISGDYVHSGKMIFPADHTLTETLKSTGYNTLGVIANRLVSSKNFVRGFDVYIDNVDANILFQYFIGYKLLDEWFHERTFKHQFLFYHKNIRAHQVNRILVPVIEKYKKQNLFLFINYLDPHDPYFPAEENRKQSAFSLKNGYIRHKRNWQRPGLEEEAWLNIQSLYDQELLYLDRYLGELFEYLKLKNIYDDSIIIITSDHGEMLGEKGLLGHAIALHGKELRVPLLIRYPAIFPQNHVVEELVQTVDIVPTVLDILDMEIPEKVHGKSLVPLFSGKDEKNVREFAFATHYQYRSVQDHTWKYVRDRKTRKEELYNIYEDPDEQNNLAKKYELKRKQLSKILNGFLKKYRVGRRATESWTEENWELLRTLGYIK